MFIVLHHLTATVDDLSLYIRTHVMTLIMVKMMTTMTMVGTVASRPPNTPVATARLAWKLPIPEVHASPEQVHVATCQVLKGQGALNGHWYMPTWRYGWPCLKRVNTQPFKTTKTSEKNKCPIWNNPKSTFFDPSAPGNHVIRPFTTTGQAFD